MESCLLYFSIAALRVFINEYYDSQKKPKVAVKRKCDDSLNSCESSTLVTENSPLTVSSAIKNILLACKIYILGVLYIFYCIIPFGV